MENFFDSCIGNRKRIKRQNDQHHLNNTKLTATLPDDVLELIFSFFAIKEAVKIGALSARFRNSWTLSRNLYFDQDFVRGRSQADIIILVNKIFQLHTAPTIQSLRLHFDPTGVGNVVEEWIKKSIEKGIEELDLDFLQGHYPFDISSSLFHNESIKILKLCYCKVLLPPKFQGFGLLNTLVLKKVGVTSTLLETVFRNCLLLESMDITQCFVIPHLKIYAKNQNKFKVLRVVESVEYKHHFSRIDIDAPTLRSFHYCGHPVICRFVHVLLLNDVILNLLSSLYLRRKNPVRVYDLFNVIIFSATATFLETLFSKTVDIKFQKQQICFWHLQEFQLFMKGASFCNVYDIVSFLKSCPRLEKIFIDLNEFSFACGFYYESHHKEFVDQQLFEPLKCVKLIKLTGFKFQNYELELVKYLLQMGRFLENLVLVTPKNSRLIDYAADAQRYNQMFCSWKLSKNAKINLFDYFDDRSFVYPKHSKIFWF